MHLTLHFLGEVKDNKIKSLTEQIHSVAKNFSPFTLHLNGFGAFSNETRPRVIWIGLGGEIVLLKNLQSSITPLLTGFGYTEEDQVYSPHITIGRNPTAKIQWEKLRNKVAISPMEWVIQNIVLFQSQFTPEGVRYTVLEEFPFLNK
jgi:2'-5' RNA ligase